MIYERAIETMMDYRETYNILLINLKSISRIQPYEKIHIVDNKFIIRDERIFQFIQRWLNGDNRKQILEFIKKIVETCEQILENKQISEKDYLKIIQILPSFMIGLENLKLTYHNDKITKYILENLIDHITKLLEK
jgi:hypothetical protein